MVEMVLTRVRKALQLWQFNVGKRYMSTAFDLVYFTLRDIPSWVERMYIFGP
jgi:hypothetical protein